MRKLIKRLTIIISIVLLIPLSGLLLLKFYPQYIIQLSQRFHPYDISTEKVDISLLKPAIQVHGLSIRNPQGLTLLSTNKLSLNSQWNDLISGKKSIAMINISDSLIDIEALTQSPSPDSGKEALHDKENTHETLDIHQLLQMVDVSLHNIKLHAPNNVEINIRKLESFNSSSDKQAGINFDLYYQQDNINIPIKGQLSSSPTNNAEPTLRLHLPELDIRSLTATTVKGNAHNESSKNNTVTTVGTINTLEQAIDWSPLQQFSPLTFNVAVDKAMLDQGEISSLLANLSVKNLPNSTEQFSIRYEQTGQLNIELNDDFHYTGPLSIDAQWTNLDRVTKGADIKGETKILLINNTLTLDGVVNLNGVNAQNISLDIALDEFPFTAKSISAKTIKQQSSELFPFTTSSQITMGNKELSFSDLSLNAGKSDLAGHLSIDFNQTLTALEAVNFDLKSTQIIIPEQSAGNSDKKIDDAMLIRSPAKEEESQAVKTDKLFNDNPIDSSLLDSIDTKGQLNIGRVYYGKRILLEGLDSTLFLEEKNLSLSSKIDQLAEGKVDTHITIKNNDGQLQLSTKGSINNLLLESLALLPEDEFTGGKTDVSFSLNSKGNSTQALASGLQGDFLLFSREGVIANNSFEIIGSDLLLNLVNTINPFYKKAKNTQLKCAVVKSSIKDGKMKFDNSIAIKTSKMTVTANGNINLAKEKINLGINPKARAGVGVDISSLAKFIALKGSLAKPSIGVSAEGSLKSALQLGAAVSTGGLSLIASGIADKAISGDACKLAHNAFTH